MKTAGIITDDWKLQIFKQHLDEAGYKYTEHLGAVSGTVILRVEYEWVHKLQKVIELANEKCRKEKRK